MIRLERDFLGAQAFVVFLSCQQAIPTGYTGSTRKNEYACKKFGQHKI